MENMQHALNKRFDVYHLSINVLLLFINPNVQNKQHFCMYYSLCLSLSLKNQFRSSQNTQHVLFTSCSQVDSGLNRLLTAQKLSYWLFCCAQKSRTDVETSFPVNCTKQCTCESTLRVSMLSYSLKQWSVDGFLKASTQYIYFDLIYTSQKPVLDCE